VGAGALINVHTARAAGFSVTDCSPETGPGTIGQAISDATADSGTSETITFGCGAGSHTIPITTPLAVNMPGKTLTINGGDHITLDGGSSSQLAVITASAGTTLEHLTFAHGRSSVSFQGGALEVSGSDLTLRSDTFANDAVSTSSTNAFGGAIAMSGGALTVVASTFSGCDATTTASGKSAYGGAISYRGTVAASSPIARLTATRRPRRADRGSRGAARSTARI
jgi:hypothetical protein